MNATTAIDTVRNEARNICMTSIYERLRVIWGNKSFGDILDIAMQYRHACPISRRLTDIYFYNDRLTDTEQKVNTLAAARRAYSTAQQVGGLAQVHFLRIAAAGIADIKAIHPEWEPYKSKFILNN